MSYKRDLEQEEFAKKNEIPFEIREYFGLDAFNRFYEHYKW